MAKFIKFDECLINLNEIIAFRRICKKNDDGTLHCAIKAYMDNDLLHYKGPVELFDSQEALDARCQELNDFLLW